MLLVLALPATCLFLSLIVWPALGAYLLLLVTPLIVGIPRGPAELRPSELLLGAVVAAMAVRTLLLMLAGRYRGPRFDRFDAGLLGLILTGSLMPLLWRVGRDLPMTADDWLYLIVPIKYYLLFRVFRGTITSPPQVTTCLVLSMASAAIVALIGVMQVLDLFGVSQLLLRYYELPYDAAVVDQTRASSTLASAFGFADVMIINLTIALLWLERDKRRRWLLLTGIMMFLAGCIAAGEFSDYIGLVAAMLALGWLLGRRLQRLWPYILGGGLLGVVSLWPFVIGHRLSEFAQRQGLPRSWEGRLTNLKTFFLPKLLDAHGWVLGVQPAPRVAAPETWRQFVYIESGYLWLLWIGGIPFLVAFGYFVYQSLRLLLHIARSRADAVGIAAASAFCYLMSLLVLMLFDPHLTLRGAADLFFPLLALSRVGAPNVAPQYARRISVFQDLEQPTLTPSASVQGGTIAINS